MNKLIIPFVLPIALPLALLCAGCATGHLPTSSGRPEIAVRNADWKRASVAIASYNFSHGRELDRANPGELVLYEATLTPEGKEEVSSKTVYQILAAGDSIVIASHRYLTDDLDDETADEAVDQATLEIEQKELTEIARIIDENPSEIAEPERTQ